MDRCTEWYTSVSAFALSIQPRQWFALISMHERTFHVSGALQPKKVTLCQTARLHANRGYYAFRANLRVGKAAAFLAALGVFFFSCKHGKR